jgi:hypothetical protein
LTPCLLAANPCCKDVSPFAAFARTSFSRCLKAAGATITDFVLRAALLVAEKLGKKK